MSVKQLKRTLYYTQQEMESLWIKQASTKTIWSYKQRARLFAHTPSLLVQTSDSRVNRPGREMYRFSTYLVSRMRIWEVMSLCPSRRVSELHNYTYYDTSSSSLMIAENQQISTHAVVQIKFQHTGRRKEQFLS